MTSISSSLIIRLVEKVTGPARQAAKAIEGIGQAIASMNGQSSKGMLNGIHKSMELQQRQLTRLRGQLFDAAAMGTGLYASLKAPTDLAQQFESALLDIGQKADLTDEKMSALGKSIRALGPTLNQSSLETAKGVDFLAGMGLDPDKALILMKPIGKAATAYKAQVEDLAKAGYAALDNLKVKPEEFGRALDAMAQAGKEGAFELRDMAQYFPSLTASAQAFGMKGVGAVSDLSAALQIARKGAGDSAEAANNVANLLQKIVAPDAVKKFKKVGIDIRKELKKTQDAGGSPIEMVAKLTNKATKGNLTKISDFFEDAQVQKALRPLIQNLDEYRRIRTKASQAGNVVDEDFTRRLQTSEAQLKLFNIRMQELGLTIGGLILPPLSHVLSLLTQFTVAVQNVAQAYPGLTQAVLVATSALIGFRVAAIALRYAGAFFKTSLLSMTGTCLGFGRVLRMLTLNPLQLAIASLIPMLTAATSGMRAFAFAFMLSPLSAMRSLLGGLGSGFLSLLKPMRLVTTAMGVLRIAVISTGIGAILVGIAAAGAFIYQNWSGIAKAFTAFGSAFTKAIAPIQPLLTPLTQSFSWLSEKVSSLLGPLDETGGKWEAWGTMAGKVVGDTVVAFAQLIQSVAAWSSQMVASLANMVSEFTASTSQLVSTLASAASAFFEAGVQWIQSLWDGMLSQFNSFLEWVKTIPSKIVSAISSIDLSGIIKWPSMPSFLGGAKQKEAAPQIAGARASGGPVSSGRTYLVGEKGPELFTAPSHGRILPNSNLEGSRQPINGTNSSSSSGDKSMSVTWSGNIIIQGNASKEDAEDIAQKVFSKLNELTRTGYKTLYADTGHA